MLKTATLASLAGMGAASSCSLTLAGSLGSNMVLQRNQDAYLWGAGTVGDNVYAKMDDGTSVGPTEVNEWGFWELGLGSFEEGGPYDISVWSDECSTPLEMEDVLFGDVFLCGGQSNMQFSASMGFNQTLFAEQAAQYDDLRLFTVGTWDESSFPLFELDKVMQPWTHASEAQVLGPEWNYYSAVCLAFALQMKSEVDVPMGLVSSNWGGTMIQPWMSADALAQCGEASEASPSFLEEQGLGDGIPVTPTGLWNSMIYPLLPNKLAGAIWYQGESNVGDYLYSCELPAMITDWRANFGSDFVFGVVQLAGWKGNGDTLIADMRAMQTAALQLDGVVMAAAYDRSDYESPYGDIHPRDKWTVGGRLAAGFLDELYGKDVQSTGPWFQAANVTDSAIEISFDAEGCGSGLEVREFTCPPGYEAYCTGWEVQSATGQWVAAAAEVTGACSVAVSADGVKAPLGVRYAYSDYPEATMFNQEGFPVNAFTAEL